MGRRDNRRSMKMRRLTRQRKLKTRLAKKRTAGRDKAAAGAKPAAKKKPRRRRSSGAARRSCNKAQKTAPRPGSSASCASRADWRPADGDDGADAPVPRRQGEVPRRDRVLPARATSTRCSTRTRSLRRALLDLTLTTRDKGKDDPVPMCGVPHHAARGYIAQADRARPPGGALRAARGSAGRAGDRQARRGPGRHPGRRSSTRSRSTRARPATWRRCAGDGRARATASPSSTSPPATSAPPRPRARGAGRRARPGRAARAGGRRRGEDDAALAALLARAYPRLPRRRRRRRRARGAAELARGPGRAARRGPGERRARRSAAAAARAALRAARPSRGARCRSRGSSSTRRADYLVIDEQARAPPRADRDAARSRGAPGSLLDVLDETATALGGRLLRRWLLFPLVRRRGDPPPPRRRRAAGRARPRRATARASCSARSPTSSGWPAGPARRGDAARPRGRWDARWRSCPALADGAASAARAIDGRRGDRRICCASARRLALADARRAARARRSSTTRPAADQGRRLHHAGRLGASSTSCVASPRGGARRILAIEARERERTGIASLKVKLQQRLRLLHRDHAGAPRAACPADYVRKQTVANARAVRHRRAGRARAARS